MSIDLSSIALKKMLTPLEAGKRSSLLSMLSKSTLMSYENTPSLVQERENLSLSAFMGKMHPSHFIKPLSILSEQDRRFYISVLPPNTQQTLLSHFKDTLPPYQLKNSLQEFALEELYQITFKEDKPIPTSFLPQEKLSMLAKATHEELMILCQSLGLFDVIAELKKIIQSAVLKELESAFTAQELVFLNEIGHYQPNPVFGDIGLKNFDGNRNLLRDIVFHRGLQRFALSLIHSSKYLLWHINHTLSIDEGAKLKSLMAKTKDKSKTPLFIDQVLFTWDKRCTHSR